ncbi:hypothetical protein GOV11_04870 [Candidatus Woesearchaeota archaeon]|nr:hypothetical protein [Candidatus Woesearchaeota archaeon]
METINTEDMTLDSDVAETHSVLRRKYTDYSNWCINEMHLNFIPSSEDSELSLRITTDSYRFHKYTPQPDLRTNKGFEETISISEKDKNELQEFFLSFPEQSVGHRYDTPGRWAYICPPKIRRTPKVKSYLFARIIGVSDLDDKIVDLEANNDFSANIHYNHIMDGAEVKTEDEHIIKRPLEESDIAKSRRGTGIKVVTKPSVAKPGDFLFVMKNEEDYYFLHCGMFDVFGKVIPAGKNVVDRMVQKFIDEKEGFVRVYDGLATDYAAFQSDEWKKEFKGMPAERVGEILDGRFRARTGFHYTEREWWGPTKQMVPIVSLIPFTTDKMFLPYDDKALPIEEFQNVLRHYD